MDLCELEKRAVVCGTKQLEKRLRRVEKAKVLVFLRVRLLLRKIRILKGA